MKKFFHIASSFLLLGVIFFSLTSRVNTVYSAGNKGERCTINAGDKSGRGDCNTNTRAILFCVDNTCSTQGVSGDKCIADITNRPNTGTCGGGLACRDGKCQGSDVIKGDECIPATDNPAGNCAPASNGNPRYCISGTCQSPREEGDSCTPFLGKISGTCRNIYECNKDGICVDNNQPDLGQSCTQIGNDPTGNCKPASNGNPRYCVKGTCQTPGDKDDACSPLPGREAGSCRDLYICKDGKCQDKPPAEEKDPGPPPLPPCAVSGEIPCSSFQTGFGKWSTEPGEFIRTILGILLAVSGTIALILIMRAGYKIMTSQGKPEAIQEGRDQLTSAIVGLLFLVFSFVFLQLIGVNILRIPGFEGGPDKTIKKYTDPGLGDPLGGSCTTTNPDPVNERGSCAKEYTCIVNPGDCFDRGCQGTCQ